MSELDYTEKTCSSCKKTKHVTEFHHNKRSHDGLQSNCKDCNCTKTRQRDPEYWRAQNWKRKFGITPEQYNSLLAEQNHRCAICEKHESEFKTKLAVDHDHDTGRIRGLLCNYCNRRVVGRHRNGDLLRKMADYVEQGTDWYVPKKKRPTKRKPKK